MGGACWLGVTSRPAAIAFLCALGLLFLAISLLAVLPVWRMYGWLPAERLKSDRLRVTHALARRWHAAPPEILFLGGSQVREALPSEAFMEESLSRACGRQVTVFNATSSAQPPESSWRLLELLGNRSPSLVISGVNLLRDELATPGPVRLARALLPLGRPVHLATEHGALDLGPGARLRNRMGILFADAHQAMLGRPAGRAGDPFHGPHNQYEAPGLPAGSRAIEDSYQLLVASRTAQAVLDRNVATYRHLGEFVTERGGHMVYLLPPIAPQSAISLSSVELRIRQSLAPLAGVGEVLDLSASTNLSDADFHDSVHLLESGRQRMWPALERELAVRLGCGTSLQ